MSMFFFTALSFFFLCIYGSCDSVNSTKDDPIPPYTTSYYTQQLDNFNSNDKRTFNQRILTAKQYWKNDVLLFYPGNEAPIDEFYNNTGFLFKLAERFQALVVFAEHRYYGDTLPFGPQDTFTPANMAYLSKLMAFGVSSFDSSIDVFDAILYGGILAALLRYQYPAVFDGALAASAPMYMTAGLTESTAFFQKVTQDFADADSASPDVVRGAYADIIKNAYEGNFQFITDSMRLCNTLTVDKVEHLQGWARDAFTTMAMVDYPYPASFLGELPAYPVNIAAGLLTSSTTTNRMTKLADAVGKLKISLQYTCILK
uniref:Uncharacterized protein n=1 Tax=Amphimedon queenslandica TaxID=400682 RepID=A0A1X7UN09_AMPQE